MLSDVKLYNRPDLPQCFVNVTTEALRLVRSTLNKRLELYSAPKCGCSACVTYLYMPIRLVAYVHAMSRRFQ